MDLQNVVASAGPQLKFSSAIGSCGGRSNVGSMVVGFMAVGQGACWAGIISILLLLMFSLSLLLGLVVSPVSPWPWPCLLDFVGVINTRILRSNVGAGAQATW